MNAKYLIYTRLWETLLRLLHSLLIFAISFHSLYRPVNHVYSFVLLNTKQVQKVQTILTGMFFFPSLSIFWRFAIVCSKVERFYCYIWRCDLVLRIVAVLVSLNVKCKAKNYLFFHIICYLWFLFSTIRRTNLYSTKPYFIVSILYTFLQ